MKLRNFGSTGLKVAEIGMGCWAIGGNEYGNSYGSTSDSESLAAVKKAVELGCNFFDTADVYGHGISEQLLGIALKDVRKDVFIATKVGGSYIYGDIWGNLNFSKEYIHFAVEQSLKRLKTDYIDLYQLHNPPLDIIKAGHVFDALQDLKDEGKIKHIGISVHSLEEGNAALDRVDAIQCVFNALDPRKYELMEAAKLKKVAVIVREPLANGFLTGKFSKDSTFDSSDIRHRMSKDYIEGLTANVDVIKESFSNRKDTLAQIALKYVLSFDSVSVVIPGAKTPAQVEENMKASSIDDLTDDEKKVFGS